MLYLQIGEVTPGSFFLRLNSSRLTIRSKLVLAKFEGRDEARSCRRLRAASPMSRADAERAEHPAGQAIDDAGVVPMASSTIMRANLPSTMPMMSILPGALYSVHGPCEIRSID
jgi:hypothetical protein